MGLDLAALDLSPQQRLWHQAGLRYILPDHTAHSRNTTSSILPETRAAKGPAEGLPEPWKTLWTKAHSPCPTVWTYARLADDLTTATCSQQRRQLFKKILQALNWPKGSVFFWPFGTHAGTSLQPRPDIFWPGVAELAPKYLFCFGQQAVDVLCPQRPVNATAFTQGSIQVIVLPDPDQMLPDNRELKRSVWRTLTSVAEHDPEPFTQTSSSSY